MRAAQPIPFAALFCLLSEEAVSEELVGRTRVIDDDTIVVGAVAKVIAFRAKYTECTTDGGTSVAGAKIGSDGDALSIPTKGDQSRA